VPESIRRADMSMLRRSRANHGVAQECGTEGVALGGVVQLVIHDPYPPGASAVPPPPRPAETLTPIERSCHH
jgi:hypothetical protein